MNKSVSATYIVLRCKNNCWGDIGDKERRATKNFLGTIEECLI